MSTPWVLSFRNNLDVEIGSLTVDTYTPAGLEWSYEDRGVTVYMLGREKPIGVSFSHSGRKGTLTHIVKQPSGEPYATYDAMHAALEAIQTFFESVVAWAILTGPDGVAITVLINEVRCHEALPPHVPFGTVTLTYEEVAL